MSGIFLGQDVDAQTPFNLRTKDLRTHGVVLGMTGSGKTGLCLVLLEELVREGIPIIALDPKGDLGNLALLFPELKAKSFAPWADGKDPEELSERWKGGLAKWGLGAPAVAQLKENMALSLFTPGSTAGLTVNVLGALKRPDAQTLGDAEARRALIAGIVSGLLGLVGQSADPVRDPEHIVLSTIIESAWLKGQDIDLEGLILKLVDPPFSKVGVFPLDAFFKPDARMKLAMAFNGVIASPSFATWTQGRDLDMNALLKQGGPTQVSVFAMAHLSEPERQFFTSLLLGRLLAWTRTQPGTERLRAVLFFDEAAGYLPPHPANPPTKGPILTMMKQARAMGLGVVLATQNPVDLDYKALSNAGLWAVGRLRTEQDRKRALAGVPGEGLDERVAGLGKREFLVALAKGGHNVVASRHAMCFLRGPLTLNEIRILSAESPQSALDRGSQTSGVGAVSSAPAGAPSPAAAAPSAAPAPASTLDDGLLPAPPPVQIPMRFLDPRVAFAERLGGVLADQADAARPDGKVVFKPALYAELVLRFDEDRVGFVLDQHEHRVWFPLHGSLPTEHLGLALQPQDTTDDAPSNGVFTALPDWMDEVKELKALEKQVVEDIYRQETAGMFVCKPLKLYGKSGETRADFELRCETAIDERSDVKIAKLKDSYEKKADRLQAQISKKEDSIERLQSDLKARQAAEVINVGEMVLSMFTGRRRSVSGAVSRRTTSMRAKTRVTEAESGLERLAADVEELAAELEEKMVAIEDAERKHLGAIEERQVRLEKADIQVRQFGVLWVPASRRI
ncbi:MAG: hypothetical protein ACI9VR_004049 [Cognaticolwellia sp.]